MDEHRSTPRWARLISWIVAAAIWLWIIGVTIVRDKLWPSAQDETRAEPLWSLVLDVTFSIVVATALAAAAMFLVRLIGRALR